MILILGRGFSAGVQLFKHIINSFFNAKWNQLSFSNRKSCDNSKYEYNASSLRT